MKNMLVSTVALTALIVSGSAFAQTATTTSAGGTTTTTTTKTHVVKTHQTARKHTVTSSRSRVRLHSDVTRLEATLQEITQSNVTFSTATWRSVANEAYMLASRIYASASATHDKAAITAARNLRTHVREMRKAALAGDAAGAKAHAAEALPFAYTLADFSHPAS